MTDHHFAPGPAPLVLTVPGLGNSGAGHWQTLWERHRGDCRRVDLGQWDEPRRDDWVDRLDRAIRAADGRAAHDRATDDRATAPDAARRPVVLAAHSLGCLAAVWWAAQAAQAGRLVAAALLVAPPDAEHSAIDHRLAGFAPVPRSSLPFPAIVVASRDDPYLPMAHARRLARDWGAELADAGEIGHINAASGIADWPFGQFLLGRLLAPLPQVAIRAVAD